MKVEVNLKDGRFCTGCPFLDADEEGKKYCLNGYFFAENRKAKVVDGIEKTVRPDLCKEINEQ